MCSALQAECLALNGPISLAGAHLSGSIRGTGKCSFSGGSPV